MPISPTRLVFAVTTDLSYDQRMQRICASLAQAGYAVLLVGWQRPHSVPLGPQPYQQHRLRGWFQHGKLFYLEYNLRLLLYLLRQRAAAWACADLDAALPTWLRARLGGQPFIYDAHELFTEVPEVVARPACNACGSGSKMLSCPAPGCATQWGQRWLASSRRGTRGAPLQWCATCRWRRPPSVARSCRLARPRCCCIRVRST
ncbi:hypothetical protein GKZ68_04045 [Hymenobacter sp. BRD128]|uniref:hypothetical protein n=1 Tax=Hymenobacter sp. BRD128 TaxID=2675878 RepID=UPI0015674B26|nr:hypothetical protein [Hymenobacter sp. BRD128]QKG55883.1 hypothetical protein GKZ68_04045 [Hymenobacter sp. BRD128]